MVWVATLQTKTQDIMWWFVYLFHCLGFMYTAVTAAGCKVIGLHPATDSSSLLELVAKNVIKLYVRSSSHLPPWLKVFIPCRLKTFSFCFSMFHLTSTFGDWSECFFSTICFLVCDCKWSVNVYFSFTLRICCAVWKCNLNTQEKPSPRCAEGVRCLLRLREAGVRLETLCCIGL